MKYGGVTVHKISECFGTDLDQARSEFAFVGDSPNDAPAFAYFPHAIGVANVLEFAAALAHSPAYVTSARCGAGFREAAEYIIAARTEEKQ